MKLREIPSKALIVFGEIENLPIAETEDAVQNSKKLQNN